MLPKVENSSGLIGCTDSNVFGAKVPITGCAGDQQAALLGQGAINPGESKCTYGTGNFLLMNTGSSIVESENLVTTIAWSIDDNPVYALEGSIFTTGAAVQWLREGLGIISTSEETDELASSIPDNGGVYMVPAFTGLGAPHWDQYARGIITGLTRGTTRAHIVRAMLESIAYQTMDLVESMENDSGFTLKALRVDGGVSRNDFLMQFQADVLGIPVIRSAMIEATARGAAILAGVGVGLWDTLKEVISVDYERNLIKPNMSECIRQRLKAGWRLALGKALFR